MRFRISGDNTLMRKNTQDWPQRHRDTEVAQRKAEESPKSSSFVILCATPVSLCLCGQSNSSSIQFRRDDIQASQHRDHVADRMAFDQVRENREVDERR